MILDTQSVSGAARSARALANQGREYDPEHRKVAITPASFGDAYGGRGDPARQRDLLVRAFVVQEREYDHEHRSVTITLLN